MTNVILVNKNDEALGLMEKMEAHRKALLHRAFSVMIFNDDGHVLLQQRAAEKYHSPHLWTNACCSHQLPEGDETTWVINRLNHEMGFSCHVELKHKFIYKHKFTNGLTEHELDYVYEGVFNGRPIPNRIEVNSWRWVDLAELKQEIKVVPHNFTFWFKEIINRFY